jgi:hypothetical protein
MLKIISFYRFCGGFDEAIFVSSGRFAKRDKISNTSFKGN